MQMEGNFSKPLSVVGVGAGGAANFPRTRNFMQIVFVAHFQSSANSFPSPLTPTVGFSL